jgi:nucleotide-binding universal stress UspA family protein
MPDQKSIGFYKALEDFRDARRKAAIERVMARLTGKSDALLSFDHVRQQLHAHAMSSKQLKDIPLDAIIGSVGRYADFTRTFMPKGEVSSQRWAKVKNAVTDLAGVPPIDVYQIGDIYFVLDGNHRVSVARQLGATYIQAYVTEIKSKVPLSASDDPDSLILKHEYTHFLEDTGLDEIRPLANMQVSAPGKYQQLEEHIRVHQYYLGLDQQQEVPYQEAVASFHDTVYQPIVQIIRERDLLEHFPGRTEADLYLWICEHRAALQENLKMEIPPAKAAADLTKHKSEQPVRKATRLGNKLMDALLPSWLLNRPRPGTWRQEAAHSTRDAHLFHNILVPVSGEPDSWHALEQAILIAQREKADLHGLHIVSAQATIDAHAGQTVKQDFERTCMAAGLEGKLALATGTVSQQIIARARWNDLVVFNLAHPPNAQPLAKLSSGLRTLIHQVARPLLAVPAAPTDLQNALLAYDGSPNAWEALYLATYLAGSWGISLHVLSATEDGHNAQASLDEARAYIGECNARATYHTASDPAPQAILKTAQHQHCDFIIMGGYRAAPILEVVIGSAIDHVLRHTPIPVLICR